MNDDRVDELLDDLDRALSVQPSPSVTARVRTRIATEPARRLPWFRGLAAATAVGAAVAVAYVSWPRRTPAPMPTIGTAQVATIPAPRTMPVPERSVDEPAGAAKVQPTDRPGPDLDPAREVVLQRREPEVLVSPDVRLALEQLRAGIAAGRITAASFTASLDVDIRPTIIVPSLIVIQPFGPLPDESAMPAPVGGEPDNQGGTLPSMSPLSRTRSTV